MKQITISEYGYIGCDNISIDNAKFVGNRSLTQKEFSELKDYWESSKETFKLFTLENPKCLKATNYVGVVQTKSISLEILPKIYKKENEQKYRNILVEMLKPLLEINEIFIDEADLDVSKDVNIYELFISMFVKEMDKLIHKGLKSEYILQEENQAFLKGKLKFNEHIKRNYIHKERFFVEYDEYLQDRVENRLLKSTINMLLKHSSDNDNKKALRQQLFILDDINLSINYEIDFTKVNLHRGMEHYEKAIRFAEVFLLHNSFSSIRGDDNVFSMLFPMEKVFENYMEYVLENSKKELGINKIYINGFKGDWLLQNDNCKMINQQPDYLFEMNNKKIVVSDAKWKLFDVTENESKDCISMSLSSSDIYQIFSYLNYYNNVNDTAYIFAPQTEDFYKKQTFEYLKYKDQKNGKNLVVFPVNLDELIKNNKVTFIDSETFILN